MEWITSVKAEYQQTEEGTAKAHRSYYIYKAENALWRAGRFSFNRDVDFRIDFPSAQSARDYLAKYDSEAVLITAV